MTPLARTLIASTLVVATGLASAGPRYGHHHRYHHHHHHHHRGAGLGALAVGLAVAVPLIALANHAERTPEVVYVPPPAPLPPPVPVYAAPARPAPVIYPRHGQGPVQLEQDSRDCNRWATTQPAAMAEATVFHRAVEACMDGRGYTLR